MTAHRTPMTELEKSIAAKVASARFPPGTASKRFARDLGSGYIRELSPRGRRFLAFVAHRYRRQYSLSSEELQWIEQWISWVAPLPPQVSEHVVRIKVVPDSEDQQVFDFAGGAR